MTDTRTPSTAAVRLARYADQIEGSEYLEAATDEADVDRLVGQLDDLYRLLTPDELRAVAAHVTNRLALDIRAVLRDGQAMRDDNARLRNELGDARNQQAYMAELFDSDITGAGLTARLETGDACLQAMLALGWPRDTGISPGDWARDVRGENDEWSVQNRIYAVERRLAAAETDRNAVAADLDRARSEVASWKLRDHDRTAEVGAWMLRLGRRDGESWDKAVDRIEADLSRLLVAQRAMGVLGWAPEQDPVAWAEATVMGIDHDRRGYHKAVTELEEVKRAALGATRDHSDRATTVHNLNLDLAAAQERMRGLEAKIDTIKNEGRIAAMVNGDLASALLAFGWTTSDLPATPWAQQSAAARMATLKDMEAQIERLSFTGGALAYDLALREVLREAGIDDSIKLVAGVKTMARRLKGYEQREAEAARKLAESDATIRAQAEENGELVRTLGVINAMLRDEPVVREVVFDLGRLTSSVIKDVIAGLKGARLRVAELEADNERLKNTLGEYMAQWQAEMLDAVREAMPANYKLVCLPARSGDSRAWFSWSHGLSDGSRRTTPWLALREAWVASKPADYSALFREVGLQGPTGECIKALVRDLKAVRGHFLAEQTKLRDALQSGVDAVANMLAERERSDALSAALEVSRARAKRLKEKLVNAQNRLVNKLPAAPVSG